jgi:hypothetical protein
MTTYRMKPIAHARQAVVARLDRSRVEALAVIGHRQLSVGAHPMQSDLDPGGLRIFEDVGEAFLCHAVQSQCAVALQTDGWVDVGHQATRKPQALIFDQSVEGCLQTQMSEQRGVQVFHHPALEVDAVTQECTQPLQTFGHRALRRGGLHFKPGHIKSRSRQDRAQLVVQLACQRSALGFACLLQTHGERGVRRIEWQAAGKARRSARGRVQHGMRCR